MFKESSNSLHTTDALRRSTMISTRLTELSNAQRILMTYSHKHLLLQSLFNSSLKHNAKFTVKRNYKNMIEPKER